MAFRSFVRRICSSTLPPPKAFNRAISGGVNVQNQNGSQFIPHRRFSYSSDWDQFDLDLAEERGIHNEFAYKKKAIKQPGSPYLTLKRKYGDEKIHIEVLDPIGSTEQPFFPMKVRIFYDQCYEKTAEFEIKLYPGRMDIRKLYLTQRSPERHIQFLEKSVEDRGITPSLVDVFKDFVRKRYLIYAIDTKDTDTDNNQDTKTQVASQISSS